MTASGKFKVLYNNGNNPDSIIRDSKGNIYGTTFYGGTHSSGTVFKLNTSYKETVLYNFKGKGDGEFPVAIAMDKAGNLYGITEEGGYEKGKCDLPDSPVGCGTVFKINTSRKFSVLLAFNSADGNDPNGLIVGPKGNLYGTSFLGGNSTTCSQGNCGLIFKLAAGSYKDSTLYNFTGGADGDAPSGALIEDSDYNLYGTALYGGNQTCKGYPGCGVVFVISAN